MLPLKRCSCEAGTAISGHHSRRVKLSADAMAAMRPLYLA